MLQPFAVRAVSQYPEVRRNTLNAMPQTAAVTRGFVLRCDPNSKQPCLCVATESQLGASPAPGVVWSSGEVVMN